MFSAPGGAGFPLCSCPPRTAMQPSLLRAARSESGGRAGVNWRQAIFIFTIFFFNYFFLSSPLESTGPDSCRGMQCSESEPSGFTAHQEQPPWTVERPVPPVPPASEDTSVRQALSPRSPSPSLVSLASPPAPLLPTGTCGLGSRSVSGCREGARGSCAGREVSAGARSVGGEAGISFWQEGASWDSPPCRAHPQGQTGEPSLLPSTFRSLSPPLLRLGLHSPGLSSLLGAGLQTG